MISEKLNRIKKFLIVFCAMFFILNCLTPIESQALKVPGSKLYWEGTLDKILEINDVEEIRNITNNYKDFAKDILIKYGYLDEDSSTEEIVEYVEKNASQIKVVVNVNDRTFELTDSIITPPGVTDVPSTPGENSTGNINTEDYKPSEDISSERLTSIAKTVIGIIQIIGTVASVIIIIVIGIRYITGSVEERAEYKTTATLYIIGAVFLFCTVTIIRLIYNISTGIFN